jgi:hypothetical protein
MNSRIAAFSLERPRDGSLIVIEGTKSRGRSNENPIWFRIGIFDRSGSKSKTRATRQDRKALLRQQHESEALAFLGYITPEKHTLENAYLALISAASQQSGSLRKRLNEDLIESG